MLRVKKIIVVLFLLYLCAVFERIHSSANFVKSRNEFSSVAVAIVFFGDSDSNNFRMKTAIDSYKSGLVKSLGFVGGCRPAQHYFGSQSLAAEAERSGVPPEHIFVGRGSHDTKSNLKSVSQMLKRYEWKNIAFVSDPLHLQRINNIAAGRNMQGVRDERILEAKMLETEYGDKYLTRFKRGNYEIIVSVLGVLLSEKTLDAFVRKLRLGQLNETDYAQCIITPTLPDEIDYNE